MPPDPGRGSDRWREDVHAYALALVEHPNWTNLMRLTEIVKNKDKYADSR